MLGCSQDDFEKVWGLLWCHQIIMSTCALPTWKFILTTIDLLTEETLEKNEGSEIRR